MSPDKIAEIIDPATYDGKIHEIPFEIGEDFTVKQQAYSGDGFFWKIGDGVLYVQKCMNH